MTIQEDKIIGDLLATFVAKGVPFVNAKLLVAQAMHETKINGFYFYSRLCKIDNNCYGMKIPSKRKSPYISGVATTKPPPAEGTNGYAAYRSLTDSALDRLHKALYDKINWSSTNTVDSFVAHIAKKGYFGYNPSSYAVSIYKSGMNNGMNDLIGFNEPAIVSASKKKVNWVLIALIVVAFYSIIKK